MNVYLEKIASLRGMIGRGKVLLRQAKGTKVERFAGREDQHAKNVADALGDRREHITPWNLIKAIPSRARIDAFSDKADKVTEKVYSAKAASKANRTAKATAQASTEKAKAKINTIKKKGIIGAAVVGTGATAAGGATAVHHMNKKANEYLEKINEKK